MGRGRQPRREALKRKRNDKKIVEVFEPDRPNLLHANPGMAYSRFKKVEPKKLAESARLTASEAPTRARAVLTYLDLLVGPSGGLRVPRAELEADGDWGRRDYTDRTCFSMRGEPEAVDATTLEHYAQQNATRFVMVKDQGRALVPLAERVARLEMAAACGDERAKRQLFVIGQRVEAHERGEARKGRG